MDNRVRDLDQIQEQDGDDRSRRLGTVLMATLSIVGLTFAMGVVVGRAAEPEPKADDPLAKLERTHGSEPAKAAQASRASAPKVEPANLTFPSALTESEDRPEVLAALQAAAAEEAALEQTPAQAAELAPVPDEAASEARPCEPAEIDRAQMVASIPAAVAAGPGARSLPKVLKHDSLVAAAMQPAQDATPAPHGHSGEFTLQVISYDRPEPSRAFADGLRQKGHAAFVTAADVPDRGRYYRVRIGPFKNRELAESYRRKFEDEEHMNTFVVRVKPDEG
jgi:cell division septation protein DedD